MGSGAVRRLFRGAPTPATDVVPVAAPTDEWIYDAEHEQYPCQHGYAGYCSHGAPSPMAPEEGITPVVALLLEEAGRAVDEILVAQADERSRLLGCVLEDLVLLDARWDRQLSKAEEDARAAALPIESGETEAESANAEIPAESIDHLAVDFECTETTETQTSVSLGAQRVRALIREAASLGDATRIHDALSKLHGEPTLAAPDPGLLHDLRSLMRSEASETAWIALQVGLRKCDRNGIRQWCLEAQSLGLEVPEKVAAALRASIADEAARLAARSRQTAFERRVEEEVARGDIRGLQDRVFEAVKHGFDPSCAVAGLSVLQQQLLFNAENTRRNKAVTSRRKSKGNESVISSPPRPGTVVRAAPANVAESAGKRAAHTSAPRLSKALPVLPLASAKRVSQGAPTVPGAPAVPIPPAEPPAQFAPASPPATVVPPDLLGSDRPALVVAQRVPTDAGADAADAAVAVDVTVDVADSASAAKPPDAAEVRASGIHGACEDSGVYGITALTEAKRWLQTQEEAASYAEASGASVQDESLSAQKLCKARGLPPFLGPPLVRISIASTPELQAALPRRQYYSWELEEQQALQAERTAGNMSEASQQQLEQQSQQPTKSLQQDQWPNQKSCRDVLEKPALEAPTSRGPPAEALVVQPPGAGQAERPRPPPAQPERRRQKSGREKAASATQTTSSAAAVAVPERQAQRPTEERRRQKSGRERATATAPKAMAVPEPQSRQDQRPPPRPLEERRHQKTGREKTAPAASAPRHGMKRGDALTVLGLQGSSVSSAQVRSAYKQAALRWHPDRPQNRECKAYATERFQEVKAAFELLSEG